MAMMTANSMEAIWVRESLAVNGNKLDESSDERVGVVGALY